MNKWSHFGLHKKCVGKIIAHAVNSLLLCAILVLAGGTCVSDAFAREAGNTIARILEFLPESPLSMGQDVPFGPALAEEDNFLDGFKKRVRDFFSGSDGNASGEKEKAGGPSFIDKAVTSVGGFFGGLVDRAKSILPGGEGKGGGSVRAAKTESDRWYFSGPPVHEFPEPSLDDLFSTEERGRRSVVLGGTVVLLSRERDKPVYALLSDSGRKLPVRNPTEGTRRELAFARAEGKRVLVTADALLLDDGVVVLDGAGFALGPVGDSHAGIEERLEREIFWGSPVYVLIEYMLSATERAYYETFAKYLVESRRAREVEFLESWHKSTFKNAVRETLAGLTKDMDPDLAREHAIAKVRFERICELVRKISKGKSTGAAGTYRSRDGVFDIGYRKGVGTLKGERFAESHFYFEGRTQGESRAGWQTFANPGHADFHILASPYRAFIVYEGTPATQGVPEGTHFYGIYEDR